MTLGSDVSRLSTNAVNAAAQGLSIVVPLYNEAAGLASLHARLGAPGTAPQRRDGPARGALRPRLRGGLCRRRQRRRDAQYRARPCRNFARRAGGIAVAQ